MWARFAPPGRLRWKLKGEAKVLSAIALVEDEVVINVLTVSET
jgi:hypothetical protein